MSEITIEMTVCGKAELAGYMVRKCQWIGRRGAPDRLVLLPLRVFDWGDMGERPYPRQPEAIWVELKAPGKKPEPHQEREHQRLRAMGQRVEVIDSIEGVERLLQ